MTRKITARVHRNVVNLHVPDDLNNLTPEEVADAIAELARAHTQVAVYEFRQRIAENEAAGAGEVEARVMALTGLSREQLAEVGGLSEEA